MAEKRTLRGFSGKILKHRDLVNLDHPRTGLLLMGIKCQRVDGVVGYRICLTHRRSSVRTWVDSYEKGFELNVLIFISPHCMP